MIRKPIPKNPRIMLLTNGIVGYQLVKFLVKQNENIVGLVTHPKETALYASEINQVVSPPFVCTATDLNNKNTLRTIKALKPDVAICAWFGYILKKEFLTIFPSGCINTHNSLLPYNRGKYPQSWAIYLNNPYGVTLHYVDEFIDRGDILVQKPISISITDTGETLYDKSMKEMTKLFIKNWPKIKNNSCPAKQQDPRIATHHYARDISIIDRIDLYKKYTALDLINRLRARSFRHRTYAYFIYKKKKIFLKLTLGRRAKF